MSEFRQNPITKAWVLIAPNRGKRPEDYRTYSVMEGLPELDRACVFCPGNENLNPELYRFPDSPEWQVRIIPNKFHSLEETAVYRNKDFYESLSGSGLQEVIITRKHNEPVALQSIATVELALRTFVERINLLAGKADISYVQIFHNHGRDAGASLVHPHFQIIATGIVPPHVHAEILGCYNYFSIHQECVYCAIIKEELKLGHRLVYENQHFAVISAYASRSPFETWILPKKHSARFEEIGAEELKYLAFVLKVVLGQLYAKLSDPPLNFYFHTMPVRKDRHTFSEAKSYHWHLTIFPRITIWAGYEFATGIPINPMAPEATARFLRGDSRE